MARPIKEGLDYFPLDVDIDQDDKLIVPIGKHGTLGFGIVIRLMMAIYKNGYFYFWGEKEQYAFANRVSVDINTINEVVNECLKWGFFHQDTFDKHGVLTSRGFQNRYIGGSKRRKSITFIKEYTLIDLNDAAQKVIWPITLINVDGNLVNVYKNPGNCSAETPQREREIERENESKKNTKDISAEISDFRSRYSPELLKKIDNYLQFIAETRKSKKISESVVHKIMTYFAKYSPVRVEYAILTHMATESKRSAKEEYTFGIVKNSTEEEATKKLQVGIGKSAQKRTGSWDREAYLASLEDE
ncbi:DUF4373 domain-containing protein [Cohnella sp. GCM10020058]|uniref:DUF4373 domain-containing protein n=1 Tax=Cohnella sp. GCM10020058 TaxID=3317330 RepID=UPI003642FD6D